MNAQTLALSRYMDTLNIAAKEARLLRYSRERLYADTINAAWVEALDENPEKAEILEAFVSRFGRLQDTLAGKLLPRWLSVLAEIPGSQIEVLQRAERLQIISNVDAWLEARQLRNYLIHEYMNDPAQFAERLLLAEKYSLMLMETYNRIRQDAIVRLHIDVLTLPKELNI
jgi:hypothetical protein